MHYITNVVIYMLFMKTTKHNTMINEVDETHLLNARRMSGRADERRAAAHDGRVFDERTVGMRFVGRQFDHVEAKLAERTHVLFVLATRLDDVDRLTGADRVSKAVGHAAHDRVRVPTVVYHSVRERHDCFDVFEVLLNERMLSFEAMSWNEQVNDVYSSRLRWL